MSSTGCVKYCWNIFNENGSRGRDPPGLADYFVFTPPLAFHSLNTWLQGSKGPILVWRQTTTSKKGFVVKFELVKKHHAKGQ